MPLERFAAAWREQYVSTAGEPTGDGCVFCHLSEEPVGTESGVLWRGPLSFVVLNAFPYGSGHVLVLPRRHASGLDELTAEEYGVFSETIRRTARALELAYRPDGLNVGMNLGRAAGAGIPGHLHAHALPRWYGDTNFMTAIAEVRVLPESLESTWRKVQPYLETPTAPGT
ncbi:MAG: HIT family protein [Acidimicrobiales bacterium]